MYLPLAGLITLVVAGVGIAARSLPAPFSRHRSRVFAVIVLLALPLAVRTFARNREYSSALTLAETVLARWPSPNAHQLVGTELAAAGRSSEAIEHLRAAAPGYPPARYFLGSELIGAGRIDEGIAELETFIREEPRVLAVRTAHGLLANAYAGRERFADALPHYREYLAAHPRDGNAWTGLGIAQVRLGLTPDSLESFRRAAQADPANGRFQLNLARAHLERGELSEARRIALEAAAGHPDDPAAHDIIGRVLLSEGRIEEARRAFERALQIDPAFAPAADALRSLAVRRMP
jgi:tetratricopeptide (TPR) repeat protein